MKRLQRLVSIVLAVTLVLCALPAAGSVAGSGVIFLAVNDAIPIALSAETMPFYSGGTLYVPYTLFNVSALGVTSSYNVLEMTLTLFNINGRIVFDLSSGTSTDSANSGAAWSTITKGGTVFVPAYYCATFFGIGISYLTSLGGYSVVRFTTGDQVYDDDYFLEKADSLIETRADQYFDGTNSVSSTPQVTVTASASPSTSSSVTETVTPTPSPSVSATPDPETESPEPSEGAAEPEPSEEEEPAEESTTPSDIYLIYYNAEGMEALAEALEEEGMTGAFFLTAQELERYPTLLSRLWAGGHAVGLLLNGTEDDPLTAVTEANMLADQLTKRPLLWVYAPDEVPALTEQGYLVLTPVSSAEAIVWEIDSTEGMATIDYCLENGCTVCTLRETTVLS